MVIRAILPRPRPLAAEGPKRQSPTTHTMGAMSESAPPRSPGTVPALDPAVASRLSRDAHGLVPAVAQQWDTGEVLMVAWMDDEALRRTLTTGRATYWSRSRQQYWCKGETSGHRQWVRSVALDCDGDSVLVQVDQEGPACHTGDRTCFDAGRLPAVVGGGGAHGPAPRSGRPE
jgi:phosphoribosyl-AMP cyclohydrolase